MDKSLINRCALTSIKVIGRFILLLFVVISISVGCDNTGEVTDNNGVDSSIDDVNNSSQPATYDVLEEDKRGLVRLYLTDFPIKDKTVKSVIVTIKSIEVYKLNDTKDKHKHKHQHKHKHKHHYKNHDKHYDKHHAKHQDKHNNQISTKCNLTKGEWLTVVDYGDKGRKYDLLQLQNGIVADLGHFRLDKGTYSMIKINLDQDNLILLEKDGNYSLQPLKIPSWSDTKILVVGKFEVEESGITNVLVDFDAQKSVHYSRHWGYFLIPIILIKDVETSENVVQTIYSADGGEINVWGDISVTFPPDALPGDMDITLKPVGVPLIMPFSSARIIPDVYEIGPDGQMLYKPASIMMHYDDDEVTTNGLDEASLRLYYFNTSQNKWIRSSSTLDSVNNTVTADVNMLADVGIGGFHTTAPTIDTAAIVTAGLDGVLSEVPLKVTAEITDPDGLEKVVLHYRETGGLAFNFIDMELADGDQYEAAIPLTFVRSELDPTGMDVYIEAVDGSGETSYAPVTAPVTPHLYEYDPDLDDDGMNDRWELENGLDITVDDSALDLDGDGTSNIDEYKNDTDPDDPEVIIEPENIAATTTVTKESLDYDGDLWDFNRIDSVTSVTPPESAVAYEINYNLDFVRFYVVDNGIFIRYANKVDTYTNMITAIPYTEPSTTVMLYRDYDHISEYAFVDGLEDWHPLPLLIDMNANYTIRAWNENGDDTSATFSDFHANQ